MCVLCGETDFTEHNPCPLSIETDRIKIEAEKNRIEAEKIRAGKIKFTNKNHDFLHYFSPIYSWIDTAWWISAILFVVFMLIYGSFLFVLFRGFDNIRAEVNKIWLECGKGGWFAAFNYVKRKALGWILLIPSVCYPRCQVIICRILFKVVAVYVSLNVCCFLRAFADVYTINFLLLIRVHFECN